MQPGDEPAHGGRICIGRGPVVALAGVQHVVDTPLPTVAGARYEGGHARHECVAVPPDRTQGRRDLTEANRGQVRREVHARLRPGARAREELDHGAIPHHHRFVGLVDAHGAFRSAERDRGGEPLGAQGSRRAGRQHPEQRSGHTVAGDGPADAITVRSDRRHEHVVLGGADREPPAPQRDQVGQTDPGRWGSLEVRGQPELHAGTLDRSPDVRHLHARESTDPTCPGSNHDLWSLGAVSADPLAWHRASDGSRRLINPATCGGRC